MRTRWLTFWWVLLLGVVLAGLYWGRPIMDTIGAHLFVILMAGFGIGLGVLTVISAPRVYLAIKVAALKDFSSRYVDFQGEVLRLHDDGEAPWLDARDVHRVLGLRVDRMPRGWPEDCFRAFNAKEAGYSLLGLQRLTAPLSNRTGAALLRWFEYEVQRPWIKQHRVRIEEPIHHKPPRPGEWS
jgi:hypothetical protein